MLKLTSFIILILMPTIIGCSARPQPAPVAPTPAAAKEGQLRLISSAFQEGQPIPSQYTCKGVNVSPPLEWGSGPKTAKTITIIADDPDAPGGTWVHWVLYNLPSDNIGLVENLPPTEDLKAGGFQGKNDFGKIGYGGPCPPSGTHRYVFKVYAVDTGLDLKAGATKAEVEKAMEGHVVGQTQLVGTYKK